MANVLPENSLRAVKNEFHARVLITASLVVLIAVAAAFVPFLLASRNAHDQSMIPAAKELPQSEQEFQQEVKLMRALVLETKEILGATSTPTTALSRALALRPKGISIDQVTYARDERGAVSLSGRTASRELLDTYRAELARQTDIFSAVELPVQALVNAEGGRFTLTLLGTF